MRFFQGLDSIPIAQIDWNDKRTKHFERSENTDLLGNLKVFFDADYAKNTIIELPCRFTPAPKDLVPCFVYAIQNWFKTYLGKLISFEDQFGDIYEGYIISAPSLTEERDNIYLTTVTFLLEENV